MLNISKLLKRQRDAAADVHGALAEIRAQIAALEDQRARTETLPRTFDDAMRAVDDWLDGLERDTISISGFLSDDPRDLPHLDLGKFSALPGLFVASCRDLIRAHIAAALEDRLEGRETVNAVQREERLAAIDAELDGVCRAEERAVREAEAAGVPILRRAEARPEIVLLPDGDL